MNEKIRKLFISSMAIFTGILLLFPVSLWGVNADSESNENLITFRINNPYYDGWPYKYNSTANYTRVRFGTSNSNSLVTSTPVYVFAYRTANSSGQPSGSWQMCAFAYSDTSFGSGTSANAVRYEYSTDGFSWSTVSGNAINLTQSFIVDQEGADNIYYGVSNQTAFSGDNIPGDIPHIQLLPGQNVTAVLGVFSTGNFSYLPWNFSTSSGGLHFSDGTELDPENTTKYTLIFNSMDINHDGVITEEEVNYYNYNHNTNYNYTVINNGVDFDILQFLLYIAKLIEDGDENPGGGSGTGGGSGAISGSGITIGDGSFTQSQYQTIEENAVNVTVNNNNELSQENMQYLNNVINNNLGTEGNAFGDAISAISGFSAVARSFSGLVTIMFGFLPSWVLTIMGLMFTILFVFIVFRLIHLFI